MGSEWNGMEWHHRLDTNLFPPLPSTRRSAPARNYQLYLVPHRTFICERVLEDEGVRGQFSLVGECRLDLFPFDTDLLSLELEGSFKVRVHMH